MVPLCLVLLTLSVSNLIHPSNNPHFSWRSRAGIHKEIIKFKDGYETILGERGVNLSGGQKQRICIARALIKNPKILILDDCLSALDTETEKKIIQSLKKYIVNTTTIISSHRLSSVQNLNEIIVLKDGKIIQKGNHEKLIKQTGYYKELFNKQLTKKDDQNLLIY